MSVNDFWAQRKVLITGGHGFLGSYVASKVQVLGAKVFCPRSRDFDLRVEADICRMFKAFMPDLVIHLAARVGGIAANARSPGGFFYDNLMMGVQLLHHAMTHKVPKFLTVGTVCSYPRGTPTPFREEDLWNGYPEETNAAYGLAKKALLVQSQSYRQQYNYNAIYLIPVNLYGPGDNFDNQTSHVIPALIRRCVEAVREGHPEITVWGDGSATREFLYVEDAAEGIVLAAEHYDVSEPVNLGSSFEISIKDLVWVICSCTGFTGRVVWDCSKPSGQPRRKLDTSRARVRFGWQATTSFSQGLARTVSWYRSQLSS